MDNPMAARTGKRYILLVYKLMISRWWTAVFTLGLSVFFLAYVYHTTVEAWRWIAAVVIGGFVTVFGLVMFVFRNSAYVQPFSDHLRLVTPFLRLNISYRRLRRTSTAQMSALFPPKSLSNWRSEIIEPLARKTALVVELNGFPTSQTTLRFFFSPFFFKDSTPHFVILVEDWMRLSTELESLRSGSNTPGDAPSENKPRGDQSILSRLPQK
jgi:hypothetical protein